MAKGDLVSLDAQLMNMRPKRTIKPKRWIDAGYNDIQDEKGGISDLGGSMPYQVLRKGNTIATAFSSSEGDFAVA